MYLIIKNPNMKKTIKIILLFYLISITACSQGQQNNSLLSPKEMSEDFEYLVKTLDEMNPDLYAFISKDEFDKKVEKNKR